VTEAIEAAAPPPVLDAGDLAKERVAPEANITQVVIEPLIEATARGGDALVESSKKIVPPPPSTGEHKVEVPTVAEASAPTASQVGEDTVEVLAADAKAARLGKSSTSMGPTSRVTIWQSSRPCWSSCCRTLRNRGSRPLSLPHPRLRPQLERRSPLTRSLRSMRPRQSSRGRAWTELPGLPKPWSCWRQPRTSSRNLQPT
jgi:hypothetical protein